MKQYYLLHYLPQDRHIIHDEFWQNSVCEGVVVASSWLEAKALFSQQFKWVKMTPFQKSIMGIEQ